MRLAISSLYLRATRAGRRRARQQANDFVLGHLGFPRRRAQEFSQGRPRRIVQLRGGMDIGKGVDNSLPGDALICRGNLFLARQDLPKAALGLKDPYGLGPKGGIRDAVQDLRSVDEGGYRSIV